VAPDAEGIGRATESISSDGAHSDGMPYAAECLPGIGVDGEGMVKLANFVAIGGALARNGFNFTICPTTMSPDSTFWLLRSFNGFQNRILKRRTDVAPFGIFCKKSGVFC
jgi:hypothetical protein